MKNTEYKLLAIQRRAECPRDCPAILENGEDSLVVVGTLLSPSEESQMKKSAKVGVASDERVVRIPRAVLEAAIDKLLTEKASS